MLASRDAATRQTISGSTPFFLTAGAKASTAAVNSRGRGQESQGSTLRRDREGQLPKAPAPPPPPLLRLLTLHPLEMGGTGLGLWCIPLPWERAETATPALEYWARPGELSPAVHTVVLLPSLPRSHPGLAAPVSQLSRQPPHRPTPLTPTPLRRSAGTRLRGGGRAVALCALRGSRVRLRERPRETAAGKATGEGSPRGSALGTQVLCTSPR